jgi:hypothetical protein
VALILGLKTGFGMINNEYIKRVIDSIIADKVMRNIAPATATMIEVMAKVRSDVTDSLREMCRSKEIVVSKTLNGYSFKRP